MYNTILVFVILLTLVGSPLFILVTGFDSAILQSRLDYLRRKFAVPRAPKAGGCLLQLQHTALLLNHVMLYEQTHYKCYAPALTTDSEKLSVCHC